MEMRHRAVPQTDRDLQWILATNINIFMLNKDTGWETWPNLNITITCLTMASDRSVVRAGSVVQTRVLATCDFWNKNKILINVKLKNLLKRRYKLNNFPYSPDSVSLWNPTDRNTRTSYKDWHRSPIHGRDWINIHWNLHGSKGSKYSKSGYIGGLNVWRFIDDGNIDDFHFANDRKTTN
jgi:hypothetical protein